MLIGGLRQIVLVEETPPHIAILLPDEQCTAPCWKGIRPAFVTHEQVGTQLSALGRVTSNSAFSWELWSEYKGETFTHQVRFGTALTVTHQDASLGDLLLALGQPDYITTQVVVRINTNEAELLVRLYYEAQQVSVIVAIPPEKRLSPIMPIEVLVYDADYFVEPYYSQAWQGFAWASQVQSP